MRLYQLRNSVVGSSPLPEIRLPPLTYKSHVKCFPFYRDGEPPSSPRFIPL